MNCSAVFSSHNRTVSPVTRTTCKVFGYRYRSAALLMATLPCFTKVKSPGPLRPPLNGAAADRMGRAA
ncbi:hypothetical protein D3C71_2096560 [compost metagenome]